MIVALRRAFRSSCFGDLFAAEEFFRQHIVGLGDLLDHEVAPLLEALFLLVGDRLFGDGLALVRVVVELVVVGDAAHQVHHAFERAGLADGDLNGDSGSAQALDDGVKAEVKVRADLVHLVDEAEARDVVFGGLPPDGFGLGFDAFLAVKDGHRAVENAEGAFDFDGEIDVAGRVDEIDVVHLAVSRPEAARGGGLDGDAALLLFFHGVHDGGAFMHFAHLVDLAGVIENPLGDGGLARVDVGGDADIADFGQVACHDDFPLAGRHVPGRLHETKNPRKPRSPRH